MGKKGETASRRALQNDSISTHRLFLIMNFYKFFMSWHWKGFLEKSSGSDSWHMAYGYREMMHSQSPRWSKKMVRISWWTRQLLPLFFLPSYQKFRTIPFTLWNRHQMVKQHCCSPWSKALFSGSLWLVIAAFAILWERSIKKGQNANQMPGDP